MKALPRRNYTDKNARPLGYLAITHRNSLTSDSIQIRKKKRKRRR